MGKRREEETQEEERGGVKSRGCGSKGGTERGEDDERARGGERETCHGVHVSELVGVCPLEAFRQNRLDCAGPSEKSAKKREGMKEDDMGGMGKK